MRYVDEQSLEKDYTTACKYDEIYGTINASLYRLYRQYNSGMFWNIYDDDNVLSGNLSFINDTFTLCLKGEKCITEVAKFIDFWGNFRYIKCNYCNATKLYKSIKKTCKLSSGEILSSNNSEQFQYTSDSLCKDISINSAFEILNECFPEKINNVDFKDFNYEMNYRIRKGESFLFGLKEKELTVSVAEILCFSNKNVLIGFLATHKEHRNRGLASSLLKSVLLEFTDKNVFIFAENDKLSAFYKKIGFNNFTVWAQIETV